MLIPLLVSTCKFLLSGVQTYPVNPYLEWLGVVEKVKWHGLEHGLVRYRILYYDVGSFLPCPAPVQSLPFPSGVLRGAEHKIVLGHVLVPFLGFHCASSEIALIGSGLGPKRRMGLGHELSGPTIAPQNLATQLLVGEEGFDNAGPTSRLTQIMYFIGVWAFPFA